MVRRKVTFQQRTNATSASGQTSTSWSDIYAVGAQVRWVAGSETSSERYTVSTNQVEVKVPYSEKALGLTTDNTVLIAGKRYSLDIIDVDSDWRSTIAIRGVAYNARS